MLKPSRMLYYMCRRWLGLAAVMALSVAMLAAPARDGSAATQPAAATAPEAGATRADVAEELKMFGRYPRLAQTWTTVGGEVHGAKPDKRGPIGGGNGYKSVITGGDFRARALDELLAALKRARAGQVVFVDGKAEIDCTTRVYVDKLVIEVPPGVTLASDRGHKHSRGAMILSDTLATRPLIRAAGKNVRVTGMRIRGPDPKRRMAHHRRSFAEGRGHKYYYRFPVSDGIDSEHDGLEVDNCEIAGFSHAGVYLRAGKGHHVHHNYIHHNQYNGLGYGVCHDRAFSLIERNLFNWNRHSIAGTGRPPSGYEAAHNVEVRYSLSHCFDMHGGRDRKDGTNVAGTWLKIHHNTFWAPKPAVVIRGVPEKQAEVRHNWFCHASADRAVRTGGRTNIRSNVYGRTSPARQN